MKTSLTAIVAVVGLAAGVANAGTITAKFTSDLSKTVNITASGVYNGDVKTVAFHWTRTDNVAPGVDNTVPNHFDSYCVDLAQTVKANTNFTFNVVPLSDAGYSSSQVMLLSRLWSTYKSGINTTNESAAFQLAVWEIVYDTGLNLTKGLFKVNNSTTITNLAQSYVNAVNSSSYRGGLASLSVLRSDTHQDQITEVCPPVPTPGAAGLAMLGFAMMLPRRSKRS